MFAKVIILMIFAFSFGNQSNTFINADVLEKSMYQKEYYETGRTKAEGWLKNGIKEGYWRFYHMNGKLSEKGHYKNGKRQAYWYFYNDKGGSKQEGHYKNGKMADWWLFYDSHGKINHKCQLNGGKKNGYCLQYINEQLTSAEKYRNGKKVKKWTNFSSFKRENNLSDLK